MEKDPTLFNANTGTDEGLAQESNGFILYTAPTGKAASVMRKRAGRKAFTMHQVCELMRLDQPLAKFCLKSDLNLLLIRFFDRIPAAPFTRWDNSIQIRTQNLIWNSNLI